MNCTLSRAAGCGRGDARPRLRERSGNPNLLCIGTSATMVAGKAWRA